MGRLSRLAIRCIRPGPLASRPEGGPVPWTWPSSQGERLARKRKTLPRGNSGSVTPRLATKISRITYFYPTRLANNMCTCPRTSPLHKHKCRTSPLPRQQVHALALYQDSTSARTSPLPSKSARTCFSPLPFFRALPPRPRDPRDRKTE